MTKDREASEARADEFIDRWLSAHEIYVGQGGFADKQRQRLRQALIECLESQAPSRKQWFKNLPAEVIDANGP